MKRLDLELRDLNTLFSIHIGSMTLNRSLLALLRGSVSSKVKGGVQYVICSPKAIASIIGAVMVFQC